MGPACDVRGAKQTKSIESAVMQCLTHLEQDWYSAVDRVFFANLLRPTRVL